MKVYKTQREVEKDIKNGVLVIDDDVKFECNINIDASINASDINAHDINAYNIDAYNIDAYNIDAYNIDASDINAHDINASDISYYAFCLVYGSITCKSIEGKRDNHQEPICLDGELTIKDKDADEVTMAEVCKKFGKKVKIVKEEDCDDDDCDDDC